jgi:AraC-like DNA-binding protein
MVNKDETLYLLARELYAACDIGLVAILDFDNERLETPGFCGHLNFALKGELKRVARCLLLFGGARDRFVKVETCAGRSWLALRLEPAWDRGKIMLTGPFCPFPVESGLADGFTDLRGQRGLHFADELKIVPCAHLILRTLDDDESALPFVPRTIILSKSEGQALPEFNLEINPAVTNPTVSAEGLAKITLIKKCVRDGEAKKARKILGELLQGLPKKSKTLEDYRYRFVWFFGACCETAMQSGLGAERVRALDEQFFLGQAHADNPYMLGRLLLQVIEQLALGVAEGEVLGYSLKARRMMRYIKQNYCKKLTLSEIAPVADTSPSYASNLLKRETGKTLSENIQFFRVEEAKRLLVATELPIGEIALRLGFRLPNHFARVFKAFTGKSPREYRKIVSTI